jgi:dephospho-CoA kinase
MPLKIGITGGIGSGKSYICGILEKMGYPVYYSDKASKQLTIMNETIRKGLIQLLGETVYQNNELNKEFLASKIFQDDSIREKVNAIIHPVVRADFNKWAESQKTPIVFNEAAILIETGSYKTLDFTIVVTAVKENRIQRTMKRDNISREDVLARMDKQWEDEEKIKHADFVVYNDERPLLVQLEKMEQHFRG